MSAQKANPTDPTVDAIVSLVRTSSASAVAATQAADMIASTIGSLVPRQQRALCTRLSGETQVPLPVVQQLLHAQVDGFDAFIASTKHLSDEAGLEIIRMSGAGRYARALARRLNVSIDVRRALRDLGDAAIDRALELRQMGPV
ncbi:MAG: hypothetical protein AAFR13_07255, partial [Pseudomonadota bacterium]